MLVAGTGTQFQPIELITEPGALGTVPDLGLVRRVAPMIF
jgi:hypothetical protein